MTVWTNKIEPFVFGLLCIGALFTNMSCFTDTNMVPKWFVCLFILGIGLIYYSIKANIVEINSINISVWSLVIVISAFAQALYGIAQYFRLLLNPSNYQMVGSFDNPAGFAACLCAGFPFVLMSVRGSSMRIRFLRYFVVAVIILAVILSGSRTGMVVLIFVGGVLVFSYVPFERKGKLFAFLFIFIILLFGIYFLRKDSANGRLLIWCCSWEMLKDSPFYGYGAGGFMAHYMDYQASCFREHPRSYYALLAGNTHCPFNEYLSIFLNYGLFGLAVFVYFIIYSYKKNPNKSSKIAVLSLLSISIFSFFSYPFDYPFVWICMLFSISIIVNNTYYFHLSKNNKRLIGIILLVIGCILLCQLCKRIIYERKWNNIAHQSMQGNFAKVHPYYIQIEDYFQENPYFLYNYASELYESNKLNESLIIASRCRLYWADYDLETLLGDICTRLRRYKEAEHYYYSAAFMCPCRYAPLYQLYLVYKITGKSNKARSIAQIIVNKPVKINSPTVQEIKYKMKRELNQ